MSRYLPTLILLAALGLGPGCAAFVAQPTAQTQQQKLDQITRAARIIERAGLLVEQAQFAEEGFFKAGKITPEKHAQLQRSFLLLASTALRSLQVIKDTSWANTDRRRAVQDVLNGIDDLLRDLLSDEAFDQVRFHLQTARLVADGAFLFLD